MPPSSNPDAYAKKKDLKLNRTTNNQQAARMKQKNLFQSKIQAYLLVTWLLLMCISVHPVASQQQQASEQSFPGVAPDLQSFCSARPSLPIDLATMIVHVKRNNSFNYKLYLFSGDDYVFQTGQIVPRDDFRVHSFPVKMKKLSEFWPSTVATYETLLPNKSLIDNRFDLRQFFQLVPLNPVKTSRSERQTSSVVDTLNEQLPGDPSESVRMKQANDDDLNDSIKFDRDDQVSLLNGRKLPLQRRQSLDDADSTSGDYVDKYPHDQLIMPVGAFSSFHVNTTYLIRKDFDQKVGHLMRILIDASKFQVLQVEQFYLEEQLSNQVADEVSFLNHKLLRDPMTRITSINQIYEDWITRNFYTIVYVQRKIKPAISGDAEDIVSDRLVFRGSSAVLLGADRLDYPVRSSAFITEKNGLHYYLEFLAEKRKFYLGAIDWSKRPFKIIDSQRFPMKQTRTLYDNEELLLCPPAICYSEQPVDELIAYDRLSLNDELQQEITLITSGLKKWSLAGFDSKMMRPPLDLETEDDLALLLMAAAAGAKEATRPHLEDKIKLDKLVAAMRAEAGSLGLKLHLRDWSWSLKGRQQVVGKESRLFSWNFREAKRNELKPNKDTYGFTLTGGEIDASFRVYNELFLVASNHIISINYTLANETVLSTRPIGEEFLGLTSGLIDPITAAFYERQTNQLYFFKGDRYVGYDYASKKPLDDFLLPEPATHQQASGAIKQVAPLVSSLPVVGILGRQQYVDAIFHDYSDDLVYIFSGMKFYTYKANEFKDGSFYHESSALPRMQCINENLLLDCNFDEAYPNPCRQDEERNSSPTSSKKNAKLILQQKKQQDQLGSTNQQEQAKSTANNDLSGKFNDDQQTRLRYIATGRQGGLMDYLLENTLISRSIGPILMSSANDSALFASTFTTAGDRSSQEKIVMYLLFAMVTITILITVAMIVIVVHWAKVRPESIRQSSSNAETKSKELFEQDIANLTLKHYASNDQFRTPIEPMKQLPPRIQQILSHQLQGPSSGWLHEQQRRSSRPAPMSSQFSPYFVAKNNNQSNRQSDVHSHSNDRQRSDQSAIYSSAL